MSLLKNVRDQSPGRGSLLTILAFIVLLAIAAGYFYFVNTSILAPMRTRQDRAAQLASAEGQLLAALRAKDEGPDQLRAQLADAQAQLVQASQLFLSEAQAAEIPGKIYQYASESSVEIIDLQTQLSTTIPNIVEATIGAGASDEKQVFDTRTFQVKVRGAFLRLANFVSRIREASVKSMMITSVNIAGEDEQHVLTMQIVLYTWPFASESGGQSPAEAIPADLALLNAALTEAWESADWERATHLIKQILLIDPVYDDMVEKLYAAHTNYGYQLLDEGNTGGAITQFDAALGIKPDGKEALVGLATAVATPVLTLTVEEQLAQDLNVSWAEENWEEAIGIIEQILDINPDFDDMTEKYYAAYVNYGYQLADENRLEEAKEAFIRALEIDPEGGEAASGLLALAQGTEPVPSPSQPPYSIYVVQSGDTLFSISRRFNTSVQAIMSANGLTDNNIRAGQELRIPTGP